MHRSQKHPNRLLPPLNRENENHPLTNVNLQDARCEIVVKAEHIPADQTGSLAAVGETIVYNITSTNNGNVDIARVTMLDTVGACQQ